jgi:hypothetical protein
VCAGDGTQGLVNAKQTLYHCEAPPASETRLQNKCSVRAFFLVKKEKYLGISFFH